MKLKCLDGKVRKFLVARYAIIDGVYGPITTGKLLEAECVECGEKFGCHDLYILKPMFLAHRCSDNKMRFHEGER